MVFSAAICCKAKSLYQTTDKGGVQSTNTQESLEQIAIKLNPKIRGWLNYFCRFNPRIRLNVFLYLNGLIQRWMEEKFRLCGKKALLLKYQSYVQSNTGLFIHWQKGITY